jgi:hypothetical protein
MRGRRLGWGRELRWRLIAAALGAAALSGCSLPTPLTRPAAAPVATRSAPPTRSRSTPAAAATATANASEIPTPPGPLEHGVGAFSPQIALERFGTLYINWNARDVAAQLRTLARMSVGEARSALALQASETAADPELAQAGIANHGHVEAVAGLGGDAYVVITRESTTATNSSAYAGLAPSWHVALATVVRRGGGWVISGWRPQS